MIIIAQETSTEVWKQVCIDDNISMIIIAQKKSKEFVKALPAFKIKTKPLYKFFKLKTSVTI